MHAMCSLLTDIIPPFPHNYEFTAFYHSMYCYLASKVLLTWFAGKYTVLLVGPIFTLCNVFFTCNDEFPARDLCISCGSGCEQRVK